MRESPGERRKGATTGGVGFEGKWVSRIMSPLAQLLLCESSINCSINGSQQRNYSKKSCKCI
jgi:hypothetical protein